MFRRIWKHILHWKGRIIPSLTIIDNAVPNMTFRWKTRIHHSSNRMNQRSPFLHICVLFGAIVMHNHLVWPWHPQNFLHLNLPEKSIMADILIMNACIEYIVLLNFLNSYNITSCLVIILPIVAQWRPLASQILVNIDSFNGLLHLAITRIYVGWSSIWFFGIHLRLISQKLLNINPPNEFENTVVCLFSHLLGAK